MDFINLNTEYESLSKFSKNGTTTLSNLSMFFKTLHKYTDLLCVNSKKSMETIFNDMVKYDSRSTLSKNFFEFYRYFESYISKLKLILVKLDKDIIDPLNLFNKHISGRYGECLSEFKNIVNTTYDSKKSLEKTKHKYFDSYKLIIEQEKSVIKVLNDREKNLCTDDEVTQAHDLLFKMRSTAENNCQSYKFELSKTNKIFEENEKKYYPTMAKMKLNEENRISFVKFHFEKFGKIMEEFSLSSFEISNRLNNSFVEINAEEDLKDFDERFNYKYKNNERIPKEEFLNYDVYRKNLEKILGVNSNVSSNSMGSENHNNEIDISTYDTLETEEIVAFKYIDEFFRKLRTSENELPSDDIGKFLNMLNDNIPYSQNVIDRMLLYYKNNFFTQINNYNNFNHFAGLLNTILFNIDRKKEYLDINFAIIYIAEKTFYKNKENSYNKIYLCSLLSKNKIFSDKKFWDDLIDLKLNSVVDNKLPAEIKKKENELIAQQNKLKQQMQENQKKEEEENTSYTNYNPSDDSSRKSSLNNETNLNTSVTSESLVFNTSSPVTHRKSSLGTGSLMNMFGNKVKNFFSNNNSANNNSELNKNLSHSLDVDSKKHLKLEPLLQVNKEQILESLRKNESANIIREFLTHFCNFNFDVSEANDLIVEYSIKYNYEPEKVNLYISMLNSNMFTIKNKSAKVSFVDFKTSGIEKNFKKYINLNDNKLIILASSLKYVNLTDYPNLLTINKNYNKKISKIMFSNILLNYQDSKVNNGLNKVETQKKIRLGIWRRALNINDLKKANNYQEILKEIETMGPSEQIRSHIETIQLDINRTPFENDVEKKRSAIFNILKAVAYKKPEINYCQGMNYIAAFLYEYTLDEEESFFFFLGMLQNTEYGEIFLNELVRLKQFFYILDRLVFIYMPELYFSFKNSGVLTSFFCSPWFITLFTNSYQYIADSKNPKVLLFVLDNFILKGWKAMLKACLCVIKFYEENLLLMKYEELLHFLINDVIKYGFFQSNNFENFLTIFKNINIPSCLISNLENEYYIDSKIKDIEDKRNRESKL